jgi:hypothetical protein
MDGRSVHLPNFLLLVMLNSSVTTCQIELLQIHQKEFNEEQFENSKKYNQ